MTDTDVLTPPSSIMMVVDDTSSLPDVTATSSDQDSLEERGTASSILKTQNNIHNGKERLAAPRAATFGSVRIAWHKLSLGEATFGATTGVPLRLGERDGSLRMSSVDAFSEAFHKDGTRTKKKLERMQEDQRREIALQHHTEDELLQVEREVQELTADVKEAQKAAQRKVFLDKKKRELMAQQQVQVGGGGCCGGR